MGANLMRIWIVSFLVLFALVQFYQWAKGFISPLPIYVLGGAFLAIASNYEKGICSVNEPKSTILNSDNSSKINLGEQNSAGILESNKN